MGKVRVRLRGSSSSQRPGNGERSLSSPHPPGTTAGAMCHAPFSSLWLLPSGDVRTCCVSTYDLGNITRERLRDLWHGPRLAALREAALRGDYSLGCQHCQHRKDGLDTLTRHYEHLATDTRTPAYPQKVLLSLSNSCNLRCIQCNGDLSSSHRVLEGRPALPKVYGDAFFEDFAEFIPHLREVQFLGGEPFLIPEYHRLWDLLAADNPDVECFVTTNGTQWNRGVERALSQLRFNLEISLDGATRETFEKVRVGADHAEVLRNVERFVAHARERGTSVQINHCLMAQNYDEFGDLLLFADSLEIPVQVEVVVAPSACALEAVEDLDAVRRSFERQAAEIRPRLGRNAPAFDAQLERVLSARMVAAVPLVGLPRTGRAAFGPVELADALGRSVAALPSAHVTVGLDERIAAASDDFATLTGVARGEVVGGDLGALDRALASALGARRDLVTTSATDDLIQQEVVYGSTRVRTFVAAQRDETGSCRSVRIHVEPVA